MSIKTIESFIEPAFREWLIWFWHQLPDKCNTGQKIRAFLHHHLPWNRRLHDKLYNMVAPYEERDFSISTAYLSDDYAPGGIHSDGYLPSHPEKNLSHTYLVPLAFQGRQHTVVFDQISHEAVTFNSALGMGNAGIVNYRQVDPQTVLQDKRTYILPEIYNEYLTHLSYECVQGLTISSIMTWNLNSAVSWPREYFHCAANYTAGQQRFALIMMTCYID